MGDAVQGEEVDAEDEVEDAAGAPKFKPVPLDQAAAQPVEVEGELADAGETDDAPPIWGQSVVDDSGGLVRTDPRQSTFLPSRALREARTVEDRRSVAWALIRTLIRKTDLTHEDLHTVLALTLAKVESAVQSEAVFYVLFDFEVDEAHVLAVDMWTPPWSGPKTRRHRKLRGRLLERRTHRPADFGFLAEAGWLAEPSCRTDVSSDMAAPGALVDTLGEEIRSVVAAPTKISKRLTGLLVAVNKRTEGGFTDSDQHLLEEVERYAARAIQRSLGVGEPINAAEKARLVGILAGCAYAPLDEPLDLDYELLDSLGEANLRRYTVLPIKRVRPGEIEAVVGNPLDFQELADFEAISGERITKKLVSTPRAIREQLNRCYPGNERLAGRPTRRRATTTLGSKDEVARIATDLKRSYTRPTGEEGPGLAEEVTERSPPIVRLANQIIEDAHRLGASDIHVEAEEHDVAVRYRVDGICQERVRLHRSTARPLISRLKIMSSLDIAEHRLPQDGRLPFKKFNPEVDVDLRVSVLPMLHGECVCLRLLDKHRSTLPLPDLGFSAYNLDLYRRAIRAPYGMVLHCGPTGSGKSMSLYAALNEIKEPKWKIVTAEDPVEYTLAGVHQLQIRKGIGLTFAAALRCFLRHDPDIILVGEIRDSETAKIAVEAALTGHLLFSTLHTNDAASSVARLGKLGVEPFLIASTLVTVCAQRLIRRLCRHCRVRVEPEAEQLGYLRRSKDEAPLDRIYEAAGCDDCERSGYRGRTGVHELMVFGSRLRQQVDEGLSGETLKQTARAQGMRTLFEDAMEKVKAGITSMEEAFRVCRPDEIVR